MNEAAVVAKPTLATELSTYHRELSNLLAHAGKHVLIAGDEVLDVYDTYGDALKAGYQKVGLNPFMVKKIEAIEKIQLITRLLVPCPT